MYGRYHISSKYTKDAHNKESDARYYFLKKVIV